MRLDVSICDPISFAGNAATADLTTGGAEVEVAIPNNKAGERPKEILIYTEKDVYWCLVQTGASGISANVMNRLGSEELIRVNVSTFDSVLFELPNTTNCQVKVVPLENG